MVPIGRDPGGRVDGICAPRRRGRRARGASAARGLPVAPDDRLEAVAAAALPDGRDERARFVMVGNRSGDSSVYYRRWKKRNNSTA